VKKLLIRFFESRREEDVFRTHYKINTVHAVLKTAQRCGFEATEVRLVSSSAALPMLGPLVIFELLFIRMLRRKAFAGLRSNLVVVLRKR
jgi:hypothetical protein